MTVPLTFTVKSMAVHNPPIQTDYMQVFGHVVLEFGPLLISGAALSRMETGEFRILFPKFRRDQRVILQGQSERDALLDLVMNGYRALTGRDPAAMPLATASLDSGTPHDPT